MNRTKKAWINAVLLVITLIINSLSAIGLINGNSQKEVSDRYFTLITPAPITFSIWGVIYFLLVLSVSVMIVKKNDKYYKKAIDEISVLFWISCVMNIVWIISFSFLLIGISLIFIFGYVIALSLILEKLLKIHDGKHFILPLTFGIYTGWLFIATVVNTAVWLVKIEWNGFGISHVIWAIIILILAVFLIFLVLMINKNAVFPLPVAWAYVGIYQSLKTMEGFQGEYVLIQFVSLAGMVVLIGMAAIQFYFNRLALLPHYSSINREQSFISRK
ncbi:TspO/MBR family protein [Psychrobacillus soli]|uniref:Tryptophan-rich sensory protein n=1 Tax=Psychrobacillus soli TaxID=1543965 RepID=A0A544TDC1_9BACI|nr:TspO/MBR family protein [Psychrobacillus soli]TQR15457.1 tryptophan-rich sensory protein [Psychrobacillus soli]